MPTLRGGIAELPRFSPGGTLNVRELEQFFDTDRPLSVRALLQRIDDLPGSITFEREISKAVTGKELEGFVTVTLTKQGGFSFTGRMRATQIPSFKFRVAVIFESGSRNVKIASQHSGEVFGSDTPGDREHRWNETAHPEQSKMIRNLWPDISEGTFEVRQTSEGTGVLSSAIDFLANVLVFAVLFKVGGPIVAVAFVVGSELREVGFSTPGFGGVVGLVVVGGAFMIFGPLAVIPAFAISLAAGAVLDTVVGVRELDDSEISFARRVFGDSLDFSRIRITNLLGAGGRAFVAPTVDGTILLNIGQSDTRPIDRTSDKYPKPGQLFIHELVHAWQIEHASLSDGFVPGLYCTGILNQVFGSNPYDYGPPGQPWSAFNMEAQGAIVDQWFGGTGRQASGVMMDPASPYFTYITNHIRMGIP